MKKKGIGLLAGLLIVILAGVLFVTNKNEVLPSSEEVQAKALNASTSTKEATAQSVKTNSNTSQTTQTLPYRNVVYYGDWSIYGGQKNFNPGQIDGSLITHLNFAFLDMDANGDLVLCDEHADFQTILPEQEGITYGEPYAGVLGAMSILRSKYPNMKIGISVGGWTRSGDFSTVAADSGKRKKFAKNIAKFVDYLGFDFVDIDWEYPGAVRDSDPAGNGVSIDEGCHGTKADGKNFVKLLQAIRDELDNLEAESGKHYELSSAMSASPAMMSKIAYDDVLDSVDFVNMMTYDMNGAWNSYTGHQTALYTNDAYNKTTQKDGCFSVDTCIQYLKDTYGKSIDYSKVVIGVAPYTRGWAGVKKDGPDKKNPGLYATAQANSVKAADGTLSGTFSYDDLKQLKSQYGLKEYYDEKAQAAYYYSADTGYFFTCDNAKSVAAKGAYVKENGLGGLIAWMASFDSKGTITKAMKESLYGKSSLPEQKIYTGTPEVSVTVREEGSSYNITIANQENAVETNVALKNAELFKKTVLNPTLYIKSKSGATFSAGSESGTVKNKSGCGVIDLSSVYAAKSLKPGASHTFTVNVSGKAALSDIEGISMTQRILPSLEEFGKQTVYKKGVAKTPSSSKTTSAKKDDTTKDASANTETTSTTKAATGSYPKWKEKKAYKLGDLISYKNKVYECTFAHTSQSDWLPGNVPTLWKERTDLKNKVVSSSSSKSTSAKKTSSTTTTKKNTTSTKTSSKSTTTTNKTLPKHMVTGYWHNFTNGSTNLKLGDVPEYYDMICVAFTGNTSTPGEVTFKVDPDLSRALGGYTKKQFIRDVKKLKANGQHVIVSVGGAEGRIQINSKKAASRFATSLIKIIEEYGFEGVDIDLEGNAVSGTKYIASALRKVQKHFGKNFIITMAPETYYMQAGNLSAKDTTTAYLRLAIEIKDILTVCYPQFYNSGSMNGYDGSVVSPGNADFLTSLCTLYIEKGGLRPDQIAIGVPSTSQAAGSGYVPTKTVKKAVNSLVKGTSSGSFKVPKKYKNFRGVMTWSINWDATNKYAWGKAMSKAMDEL